MPVGSRSICRQAFYFSSTAKSRLQENGFWISNCWFWIYGCHKYDLNPLSQYCKSTGDPQLAGALIDFTRQLHYREDHYIAWISNYKLSGGPEKVLPIRWESNELEKIRNPNFEIRNKL